MSKQILIVEDHDAFRRNLRDWLTKLFPQHIIVEAASGEQALAMVQDNPPQIVLMDITLPQMNGIAATRQIKAIDLAIQVIMLTVHQEEIYRVDATAAGATAYVAKQEMYTALPLVLQELV